MTDQPTLPPPAPTAAAAVEAKKRPWWKRWWGVALIIFVVLAVVSALSEGDQGADEPAAAARATDDPTTEEAGAEADDVVDSNEEAEEAGEPESEPESASEPAGFGNGTYTVGQDIDPGTYRSEGSSMCYWARLSGFSGELDDIIANGNASTILTIDSGDEGFETSGCGTWLAVAETAPATPETTFDDGTYQVGVHIAPGRYRADGAADDLCYWARLSDFSHELDGIIANGNNPTTIEIADGDAGFETSGCGVWTQQ
jgi:hypothetical protein